MSLYWQALLSDYDAAAREVFGRTVDRGALLLAASVAEHETNNGLAWPGSFNFGACQLRGLTSAELGAFATGALKAGDYTPSHDGVLHVDTHPPGIPYPVWFAAFPTRVAGIGFFLRTLWRLSAAAPEAPGATPASVALAMYRNHYYEGRHIDDRPWIKERPLPLSPSEQANVDNYAVAIAKCLDVIVLHLGGWETAGQGASVDQVVDVADPHVAPPLEPHTA